MSDSYPYVEVLSRAELREWLAANGSVSKGIWLTTYKRSSGRPQVPYDDIVEEALCFGWVDSRTRAVDTDRSALLLTPRRPTSKWSATNKERIERLTAAGAMAPPGLAMVELAKRTGTWTALDEIEQLIEPADLAGALDASTAARAAWDGFPRSARRAILEWIAAAKKPETRAARVAGTVSEAELGRRANQWRQPGGGPSGNS